MVYLWHYFYAKVLFGQLKVVSLENRGKNGEFYETKLSIIFMYTAVYAVYCYPAVIFSSRLNFGKTSGSGRIDLKSGFIFNTVITVTLYGTDESLLDDCFSLADTYENYFPIQLRTVMCQDQCGRPGAPVTVHEETAELIKKGLCADLSNGFDITIGKLSDLWDISTKALLDQTDVSMIPSDDEIKKASLTVGYQNVVV